LRYPRTLAERVDALIACHMFGYEPAWSDAAVRRLMSRVGVDAVGDLLALRRADQIATGYARDLDSTEELARRIDAEIARASAITVRDLAIDGDDVMRELGIAPGRRVGAILANLLDEVLEVPARNDRERLLARVREIASEDRAG
jgi:hypothetical protein